MPDPLVQSPARRRAKAPKVVKTWRDLLFYYVRGGIATFGAPSESDETRINYIDLDIKDGTYHCHCTYHLARPDAIGGCWLSRGVAQAWAAHGYAQTETAKLRVALADLEEHEARHGTSDFRTDLVREELDRRDSRKGGRSRRQQVA